MFLTSKWILNPDIKCSYVLFKFIPRILCHNPKKKCFIAWGYKDMSLRLMMSSTENAWYGFHSAKSWPISWKIWLRGRTITKNIVLFVIKPCFPIPFPIVNQRCESHHCQDMTCSSTTVWVSSLSRCDMFLIGIPKVMFPSARQH